MAAKAAMRRRMKTPSYARDSRRAAEKGRQRSIASGAKKFAISQGRQQPNLMVKRILVIWLFPELGATAEHLALLQTRLTRYNGLS